MAPSFPPEIFHLILQSLAEDSSLEDDLDERLSPFHADIQDYPDGRRTLATSCTLVSKPFCDLATPIVWQYLKIYDITHLRLLHRLSTYGTTRPTNLSLAKYTRRVDFRVWIRGQDIERATKLLSRMRGLLVLTFDDAAHGTRRAETWMHSFPLARSLLEAVSRRCGRLRRLQFASVSIIPSMRELSMLSTGCTELQTLQLSSLNSSFDHGQRQDVETPSENDDSVELDQDEDEYAHSLLRNDNGQHSHGNGQGEIGRRPGITFPALKNLSIGGGECGGFGFGDRTPDGTVLASRLIDILRRGVDSVPQLEVLDMHMQMWSDHPAMRFFQNHLASTVHHLCGGRLAPDYGAFSNLRRLVLVVHGHEGSALPKGLPCLKTVEIVTRRLPYGWDAFDYGLRLRDIIEVIFTALLGGWCPLVDRVILWRRTPGNFFSGSNFSALFRCALWAR
ncbi:hypothetical protein NMY22_g6428 [Coprinellus aureogranulatus]|nr:hypothetical protein NMY22_g6428 [Coprinellus aureogranulatus]